MEIAWRTSRALAQTARNASTSSQNTRHAGSVRRQQVVVARQRDQPGLRDQCRQLLAVAHRDPVVVAGVQDQRRAARPGSASSRTSMRANSSRNRTAFSGRGGAPLQLVEGGPVGPGAVGKELGGEDLTKRRVIAAPTDPGQIEIQCSGPLFVVGHGTHEAAPRVGARQHQRAPRGRGVGPRRRRPPRRPATPPATGNAPTRALRPPFQGRRPSRRTRSPPASQSDSPQPRSSYRMNLCRNDISRTQWRHTGLSMS